MLAATVPLSVPEVGLRLSHEALSLALQFNVPPPVFETEMFWLAGLVPPCVAVKDRVVGPNPITGGGGLTVKVTGIVGEFVAPVPETVMVAL
jgi:hypothetical protein